MKKAVLILSCLIIITATTSCISSKKQKDSTEDKFENPLIDSFKFNRGIYLSKYLDSLRTDLKRNVTSAFLYNECLDNNSASYYYLNSHTKLSLRFDLIQELTIEEVKKIISISDTIRLDKICLTKKEFMPYTDETTLQLLNMKLLKKR